VSAPWTCIAEDVVTGTALKTILQVAAASQERLIPKSIDISFDSTSATAVPVLVRLYVQTTAGTGGTTVTPAKWDQTGGTPTVTSLKGPAGTWTAEPTAGDILASWRIPPTSGVIQQLPLGDEPVSPVGGRLAITVTAAATVNATVTMRGVCA
jgi:hypothetical protein